MAEGVLVELAAKALELLATSAFKEVASWSGARDDLKKLENSIRMIQARVRDAEKYQEEEGSEVIKEWLRRLKLVPYQADDLFDHILTAGNQKLRRKQNKQSVQQHFDLTKWVCVPEVDNQKAVLEKLYGCFTGEESGNRSVNQIKLQIQDSIKNKKYFP
ncbi:hypothetical protein BVRB_6g146790 [Beta vulgaris subsp. vulgaris]|nr:hypothetical protein BVRB_6g146790 [Beta vulgaris subsp. vulgaris]